MKKCNSCGEEKSLDSFYKGRHICKECESRKGLNFRRSISGIITHAYSHQKECSLKRGHSLPNYSKEELKGWVLAQPNFIPLYNAWVDSGYIKNLKPSIDRLNDDIGYTFTNIQLVAFGENTRKQYDKILTGEKVNFHKKVNQYTLDGKFIQTFSSAKEAKRVLDKKGIAIGGCCIGTHPTAGGFYWRFFEGSTKDIEIPYFEKIKYERRKCSRPVIQYSIIGDFIKEYPSVKEAHRQTKIYERSIRDCCKGRLYRVSNFVWRYKDETN